MNRDISLTLIQFQSQLGRPCSWGNFPIRRIYNRRRLWR